MCTQSLLHLQCFVWSLMLCFMLFLYAFLYPTKIQMELGLPVLHKSMLRDVCLVEEQWEDHNYHIITPKWVSINHWRKTVGNQPIRHTVQRKWSIFPSHVLQISQKVEEHSRSELNEAKPKVSTVRASQTEVNQRAIIILIIIINIWRRISSRTKYSTDSWWNERVTQAGSTFDSSSKRPRVWESNLVFLFFFVCFCSIVLTNET